MTVPRGVRYRDADGATFVTALLSSSAWSPPMSSLLLFDDSSPAALVHVSAVLPMLIWSVSSPGSITWAPAFTMSAAGECTGGVETEYSVARSSACSGELLVVTGAVDSETVVDLVRAVVIGGLDEVSFMGISACSCCAATSTAAVWLSGTGYRSAKNETLRYLDIISA